MGLSLAKTVTRLAVLLWNTAGLAITGRPSKALCNIAEAMAADRDTACVSEGNKTCSLGDKPAVFSALEESPRIG